MTNRNYFKIKLLLGFYRTPCALSCVPLLQIRPTAGPREQLTRKQRPTGCSAFTLLEVMVAMAVMAIVLVSVYRMHSQTLTMNTASRFYTLAPMLAQSKLAEIETKASEIGGGDSGDFGDKYPGYTWNVSVEDLTIETLGEISNDFKQIDLTVALNNNEFSYSLRTYRLMRE